MYSEVDTMKKAQHAFVRAVYDGLSEGNIQHVLLLISEFLKGKKTNKFGTPIPLLNSVGKEIGKLLIKDNWRFKRLMELWKKGGRDERLIVMNALGEVSKKDYESSKSFVLNILDDISDWEICDQLAIKVVANLVIQNKDEMFSLMEEWRKSENKWIRRLAVATIPPYIRREKTESKICLQFLNEVMKEEDKDVKKAIGWALREITKKDPESVFEFLQRWAKVKDKNTKWIIKDGMRKLGDKEQEKLKTLISG
jgi:3-methyladenine DNA glycosylase AlkD